MSTEKLSELSKPVGRFAFEPLAERWHHIKHGEKQNLEGGPWDLKKLYSQEYVSALDGVAQFWIGESAGWKKRAEDAEKRIAELEAKLATPVRLPPADSQGRYHGMMTRFAIKKAGFTVQGDE